MNDYFLKILARERHYQMIIEIRGSRQPVARRIQHRGLGKETFCACQNGPGRAEGVPAGSKGVRR